MLATERSHHRTINQSPYKALFGSDPKVGLSSSALPKELLDTLETEEDLIALTTATSDDNVRTNIETETDLDTNTEKETDLDTNTETETDLEINTEMETDMDTNTETETNLDTNTETEINLDKNTEINVLTKSQFETSPLSLLKTARVVCIDGEVFHQVIVDTDWLVVIVAMESAFSGLFLLRRFRIMKTSPFRTPPMLFKEITMYNITSGTCPSRAVIEYTANENHCIKNTETKSDIFLAELWILLIA
ncbi:unnamed protein product [Mytilus edulis]|uniref:Uncharacterized protein n=1 Tax=Mytilus edulis TaxID=6550 RepID=A0A8S3SYH5_MYTED|nr:unnamed protein product [Mytilus edulis]